MKRWYKNSYRINIEHNLGDGGGVRHGHTLELALMIEHPSDVVFLSYPNLDETVHRYLEEYDKKYLNELEKFSNLPPTVEHLGELFFEELRAVLQLKDLTLTSLEISETPLRVYIVSAPTVRSQNRVLESGGSVRPQKLKLMQKLMPILMPILMKKLILLLLVVSAAVTGNMGAGVLKVYAQEEAGGYGNILIDGYFDDWEDKPHSYVINYVSSQPKNQKNYHYASLFCDGDFVYLHIKMLSGWKYSFNGNEYYFQINDRYRLNVNILDANGRSFPNGNAPLGIQTVYVKYKNDGSMYDNREVAGSQACLYIGGPQEQDELEMKLPMAAFQLKNPGLNLDNVSKIEMWCPNLIVRQLALISVGTSTGPIAGILLCLGMVALILFFRNNWGSNRKGRIWRLRQR
ncbi:hypothetical protein FRZ06_06795 [Anoxybacterium hadale]|uniref:Uncharacterized protein n=1 Tax=Anoxybacterium hadale TaxID=3408580 RepID=A0ACD1A9T0_9FIRM|nr:hypothetical protein FRZ06_06795 [Clostridiales bacterium]